MIMLLFLNKLCKDIDIGISILSLIPRSKRKLCQNHLVLVSKLKNEVSSSIIVLYFMRQDCTEMNEGQVPRLIKGAGPYTLGFN